MGEEPDQLVHAPDAAVMLAAKLDTAAARKLHETLAAHAGGDLVLDGSGVEQVGGRCLDILLAARHHWSAAGHAMHIADPSDAMQRDLAALGATESLLATGDAS